MRLSRRALTLGGIAAGASTLLPRTAGAAESKRVLLIGSSSMKGYLGRMLEEKLASTGLEPRRETRGSSSLSRPDFYDWPAKAGRLYEKFTPHASVLLFGGNDAQGLKMPDGHTPKWIRWHEPGWHEEYGRRVVEMANLLAPNFEAIVWLGMPPVRSPKFARRIATINRIVEQALAGRPNAVFYDLKRVLGGPDGGYADTIKRGSKMVKVREPDGVHTNITGAKLVAYRVAPVVQKAVDQLDPERATLGHAIAMGTLPRVR